MRRYRQGIDRLKELLTSSSRVFRMGSGGYTIIKCEFIIAILMD